LSALGTAGSPSVLIVCGDGSDLGQTHEDHGWELWFPLNEMFQAGDYEGVIAKGRESIEANPQFGCRFTTSPAPRASADIRKMRSGTWGGDRALGWGSRLGARDNDFDAIRDEPTSRELVA
jgi:hypothetical protein